jgi:alpha-beta hydrolase superfamily lysophospholipase
MDAGAGPPKRVAGLTADTSGSRPARRWPWITAGLIVVLAAYVLWPLAPALPAAHPDPARSYDESLARFERLLVKEPGGLVPGCEPRLLTHGRRTPRVVVLFHGFTNCPQQFGLFGDRCFSAGDNVLFARLPEHGFTDRRGPTLGRVTVDRITESADRAVDLACGLGDTVVVAGLSVGGEAAAWAAARRPEVGRAVIIAPLLGIAHVPVSVSRFLARLWISIPDSFHWWDPRVRDRLPGPPYCYWGWSSRGLGEMLQLGFALSADAAREPARARSIVIVTNANDDAVDNGAARSLAALWAHAAPGHVRTFEFADSLRLGHDVIDPEQPYSRLEIVYPVLERLVQGDSGEPVAAR